VKNEQREHERSKKRHAQNCSAIMAAAS
jgi:hypothetical protein